MQQSGQNALSLKHASGDLRKDKEIVFVALVNYPSCIEHVHPVLRRGMDATALLAYLKTEIIATLPERYRRDAEVLLNTKAHILSEIPFVLQDESLSDVFKMEWAQRTGPEHIAAYRDNLSKFLAMKVILQLCDRDIHSARFARLCTRENIDSLSGSIHSGLNGLGIEVLGPLCCMTESVVGGVDGPRVAGHVSPPAAAADHPAAIPPFAPSSLTQFVRDRLATTSAPECERERTVIPRIEFSEGFFESLIRESAPQEAQPGLHM